jgi:argininosuccinate synthase
MSTHKHVNRVVLAYSGGLDTSVAIKWLQEKYHSEVVTVTIDVGQEENLQEISNKAHALGVKKHYPIDAKKEFVRDYIFPAIRSNALYQGKYPLSTAIARPLIAKKLVEVARKEGANGISHGCTGKGNDQIRFDVTIRSLAPDIEIIAPVREWSMSRDEEIRYAQKNKIPIDVKKSIYSIDQNLWGRSIECGPLEDPSIEPPESAFEWTVSPEKAPEKPHYITIQFENGVPVGVDDEHKDGVQLISSVNKIAGDNGVGRIDHVEDRIVGIKSREVYECPAALTILEAHKDLEKTVLTRHELSFKRGIEDQWAFMAYAGLWADPLKKDLDAFIDETQKRVNGEVKMKLYKGSATVVGRSSQCSLYNQNLATYDVHSTFNQSSAAGFIELWGLQTRVACNLIESLEKKGE